MRYGLLALSLAMLTGGGVAAQSALSISYSAQATLTKTPAAHSPGTAYGSLPYTAARAQAMRLAAR
jgi:hypothetical protein